MKALLDFIPLLAFFVVAKKYDLVIAAGAVMVATIFVFAYHFFTQNHRLTKQQIITLLITILFCSLTLILHDKYWLQLKFSIIYWLLSAGLLIALIFKKNPFKSFGEKIANLTDKEWRLIAISWIVFFIGLGLLNYWVAFELKVDDDVYTNFKFFGVTLVQIVFMMIQMYIFKDKLIIEE